MEELIEKVEQWAEVRKLHTADPKAQTLKVVEEFTEMLLAYDKGSPDGVIDGIGDTYVTIIILAKQLGIDFYKVMAEKKHAPIAVDGYAVSRFFEAINKLTTGVAKSDREQVTWAMADTLAIADYIAHIVNRTPEFCLSVAYNEIKDRKGMMIDGTFVKYDDLTEEQQKELDK